MEKECAVCAVCAVFRMTSPVPLFSGSMDVWHVVWTDDAVG